MLKFMEDFGLKAEPERKTTELMQEKPYSDICARMWIRIFLDACF